jgi:hypothetical protein
MNKPSVRYETSRGLAFDEAGEMQRLHELAAEGWRLIGFRGLSYVLEPASPEQVVFTVDYMYEPDAEYFALCQASGWVHVVSMDKLMHVFKAPPGTPPMFSTADTREVSASTAKIAALCDSRCCGGRRSVVGSDYVGACMESAA